MEAVTAIRRMGGLGTRAALIQATSRAEVDRALRAEAVVRVGHGRYALAEVDAAPTTAHAMNAVLCLTSAALHHEWEVKALPEKPHVLVPRKRNVPRRWRDAVVLHRRDLEPDEIDGPATSRELTLVQCLRLLPYDEALVIADSALRAGEVATLRRAAMLVRGRGQTKAREVAQRASAESANAFESVTRAICHSVPGLDVEPQVVISTPHCWARPDLVDRDRRIVVECESYEWHGNRAGFRKDVRRYTLLTSEGWTVLRFTWEDVMFRADWVREVLIRTLAGDTQTLVGRLDARAA
ncbi:DUF559 domain-containing protein [Nocardioides hwasunensis]|uniref:DUF559 domain-containing protein n=1 Tax=Nocardioides hwasunensis TaxID=397258 RepID=A0ABR8MFB3_9ACTN|nr:DUF559 domain-containing protein [Nocardioides hwasunensis]MBD3914657.1 DUF559 domain-containing protein [Nocardioides hwasunensis]